MAFESHSDLRLAYLRCAQPRIERGERKRFLRGGGGGMRVPQWSRLRKFLTLSPTPSSAISSTLPPMYLQRNKRKSRRAASAYNELCWWYQPLITFAKTFLKLGFNVSFFFFFFVESFENKIPRDEFKYKIV